MSTHHHPIHQQILPKRQVLNLDMNTKIHVRLRFKTADLLCALSDKIGIVKTDEPGMMCEKKTKKRAKLFE